MFLSFIQRTYYLNLSSQVSHQITIKRLWMDSFILTFHLDGTESVMYANSFPSLVFSPRVIFLQLTLGRTVKHEQTPRPSVCSQIFQTKKFSF